MSETAHLNSVTEARAKKSSGFDDLATLLFSIRGRANRAKYWLIATLPLVGLFLLIVMYAALSQALGSGVGTVLLFLIPVVLSPGLAVAVRRLHDRDKSGHWLWLFIVRPSALDAAANSAGQKGAEAPILTPISLGLTLWGLVELGFLRGTAGPNRFGEDPLAQG